jgi:hypothetical protein
MCQALKDNTTLQQWQMNGCSPRVPADVCLKVGCLSIHLGAVGIVAPVLFLSLRAVTAPSSPSGGGGGGNTDNTACVY